MTQAHTCIFENINGWTDQLHPSLHFKRYKKTIKSKQPTRVGDALNIPMNTRTICFHSGPFTEILTKTYPIYPIVQACWTEQLTNQPDAFKHPNDHTGDMFSLQIWWHRFDDTLNIQTSQWSHGKYVLTPVNLLRYLPHKNLSDLSHCPSLLNRTTN